MSTVEQQIDGCVDSLRLSRREQDELMAQLSTAGVAAGAERRTEERLAYQKQAGMVVQMHHPGGTVANYMVRARNLSSRGIAFLHGGFVYTGTRCVLALMTIDNKVMRVEGQVARCQHVRGHVHDIGVQFDSPIRMRDFVAGNLLMGSSTELSMELPRLSGRVLYVEDSISDQELLKFHLGNAGVQVRSVSNGMAALELVKQTTFHVVITGVWLPTMPGPQIAQALRDGGYAGPIIALTADERDRTRLEAVMRGCTMVLVKPYTVEDLIGALARHLPAEKDGEPQPEAIPDTAVSELWPDERMRPLIRQFLQQLDHTIGEMRPLVDAASPDQRLVKLCLDVKGSAGGYGYPQISRAAWDLMQLMMDDAQAANIGRQFAHLAQWATAACRSADVAAA